MKKSEALKILGLADGYTDEQIKQAHRQKVRENHPDRFSDPQRKAAAEERTKLINEARDVLVRRVWEPEYGPRVSGYNPYSRPAGSNRPSGAGSSYAGSGSHGASGRSDGRFDDDPFASWPFETFVWTSWGDGTSSGSGGWPGAEGGGFGQNPFDAFSSIFTQVPEKTPAEEAAEATRELKWVGGVFAVKLLMLAVCSLTGTIAVGVLVYMAASIIEAVYFNLRQSQGCASFLIVPALVVLVPLAMTIGRVAVAIWPLAVALGAAAVVYDIGLLRRAISKYRTTREKARMAND